MNSILFIAMFCFMAVQISIAAPIERAIEPVELADVNVEAAKAFDVNVEETILNKRQAEVEHVEGAVQMNLDAANVFGIGAYKSLLGKRQAEERHAEGVEQVREVRQKDGTHTQQTCACRPCAANGRGPATEDNP